MSLIEHHMALKEKVGDTLILYKIGCAYETICDDARKLSELIGVPVTDRDGVAVVGFFVDNKTFTDILNILNRLTHSARAIVIDYIFE